MKTSSFASASGVITFFARPPKVVRKEEDRVFFATPHFLRPPSPRMYVQRKQSRGWNFFARSVDLLLFFASSAKTQPRQPRRSYQLALSIIGTRHERAIEPSLLCFLSVFIIAEVSFLCLSLLYFFSHSKGAKQFVLWLLI